MVVKTSQDSTVELATSIKHSRAEHWWRDITHAYPAVETIHEDSICKLVYVPARSVATKILIEAQDLARRAVATFLGTGVFGVEMFLLEDDSLIINEIAPRPHNSAHYTIEACHMSQYEAHLRAILPNLLGSRETNIDIAWEWESPTLHIAFRSPAMAFAARLPNDANRGPQVLEAELANILNLGWFEAETSEDGTTLLLRSR